MATQLSPGVVVVEKDFTPTVPTVSVSTGGIAGVFKWGPVGERTLIESEAELLERFWKPTDFNAETWFCAANFLAYGAPLWVVRAANTSTTNSAESAYNAIGSIGSVANVYEQVARNETHFYTKFNEGTFDSAVKFLAKYPGDLGNSLRVSACFSPTDYKTSINLASFGSDGGNFASGGAVFTINTNAKVATIVVTANSVDEANSLVANLSGRIAKYDIITVGSRKIGKNALTVRKIATTNASGNSTLGTANLTITFFERFGGTKAWTSNTTLVRRWEFADMISLPPRTSAYVDANGNADAKDECHIVVVDQHGKFTGQPGTVLEVFKGLSRANDAIGLDKGSIFYKTVINEQSRFIWAVNDVTGAPTANAAEVTTSSSTEPKYIQFVEGSDGEDEDDIDIDDLASGWDLFRSSEDVDVSLLVLGKARGGVNGEQHMNYVIDNICEIRKDCVVFGSPAQNTVVNNFGDEAVDIVKFRDGLNEDGSSNGGGLRSSSYAFLDSGYKYQYDRYNNIYRWIPLCGDSAGVTARTDATNDPWWAPAGFNRGQIKNIIKLAYNPSLVDRDLLYQSGINPVVSFPGSGTVLYGQKTLFDVQSAFNRLNVRRLFIVLEKAVARLARQFLFEFNNDFTRRLFVNVCDPFFRDIQARQGLTEYLIKCDAENNTPQVIDANKFIAQFFVKPTRVAEMIELQFFAVGTAIAFSEIEGRIR